MDFHRPLVELLDNFDDRADELAKRLNEVAHRLFDGSNLLVSIAGSDECVMRFWQCAGITAGTGKSPAALKIPKPKVRNEAFIVPTDVCYASTGFDCRSLGAPYTGVWQIAARVLSYDYLWNEVRVKGGAYGAGFQAARSGSVRFYSYRDPHLDETLERFNGTPAWLAAFDPAPEEMDGYVVSTVAGFDAPLKEGMMADPPPGRRLPERAHARGARADASGDDRSHARKASRACMRHRRGAWQGSRLRVRQQGHP